MTEVPTITLNDGNKMPLLGLGVFQIIFDFASEIRDKLLIKLVK